VSPAYTPDSVWRNRDQFFTGREAIEKFLTEKWAKEHNYRLRKELFAFQDNKMCFAPWTLPDENELTRSAVEFWYEYSDEAGERWYRTYGLEHWCFAEDGRMKSRQVRCCEVGWSSD
jgi:nuclear transport factor 2 (NTF2) superfamily protein